MLFFFNYVWRVTCNPGAVLGDLCTIFISDIVHLMLTALQIRASKQLITANVWPLTAHIYHVMIVMTGGFSNKSFLFIKNF